MMGREGDGSRIQSTRSSFLGLHEDTLGAAFHPVDGAWYDTQHVLCASSCFIVFWFFVYVQPLGKCKGYIRLCGKTVTRMINGAITFIIIQVSRVRAQQARRCLLLLHKSWMGRAGVEVTSFNIGPKDRVKVLIRLVWKEISDHQVARSAFRTIKTLR